MTGFEPATSCSQNRSATKLRYIPSNSYHFLVYTRAEKLASFVFFLLKKRVFFNNFYYKYLAFQIQVFDKEGKTEVTVAKKCFFIFIMKIK